MLWIQSWAIKNEIKKMFFDFWALKVQRLRIIFKIFLTFGVEFLSHDFNSSINFAFRKHTWSMRYKVLTYCSSVDNNSLAIIYSKWSLFSFSSWVSSIISFWLTGLISSSSLLSSWLRQELPVLTSLYSLGTALMGLFLWLFGLLRNPLSAAPLTVDAFWTPPLDVDEAEMEMESRNSRSSSMSSHSVVSESSSDSVSLSSKSASLATSSSSSSSSNLKKN